MRTENTDPRRVAVWLAMAEHFLDTETRHTIPSTALRCIEAELSIDEARAIWRYEVSPAVAFNVWDVAGEWTGWHEPWLVARIERLRGRWTSCPGTLRWLRYRMRVHFMHGVGSSIERGIELLLRRDRGPDRRQMAADLEYLGRQCFDFCAALGPSPDTADLIRLRALHPEPFRRMIQPALLPGESDAAFDRVQRALETKRR